MTRKKSYNFLLILLLLFTLCICGCSEKSFENKNLTFNGASDFDLCIGDSKTFTVQLPDNGVKTLLSVSVDKEGLSANVIDNNKLTLTGSIVGEYNITFTLTAKGYKSASAVFKASVFPKELPVSVFFNGEEFSDEFVKGFSLNYGETVDIMLRHDIKDAELSLSTPDNSVIDISGSGNEYSITGISAGGATLYVNSPLPQYIDYALPIRVEKIKAEFALSEQHLSLTVGDSTDIEYKCPPKSYIEVSSIPEGASLNIKNDRITVTSSKPGKYKITVWCKGDNYIPDYKTIVADFSLPKLRFAAPSSLTLQSGESTSFSLSDYPAGTVFSVSSGNKAVVSVSNDKVSVTAKAAGNDSIIITSSNPSYQSSSVKIPVTINAVHVKVSDKYETQIQEIIRLVNKERTDRGFSELTCLPDLAAACTIRAKESFEKWSHTRPDDREWQTALYDTGVDFISGGENLLEMNALSPTEAVKAWMDSPGHRKNMLRENFTHTYIGIYKSGSNYWYCQHFIER